MASSRELEERIYLETADLPEFIKMKIDKGSPHICPEDTEEEKVKKLQMRLRKARGAVMSMMVVGLGVIGFAVVALVTLVMEVVR